MIHRKLRLLWIGDSKSEKDEKIVTCGYHCLFNQYYWTLQSPSWPTSGVIVIGGENWLRNIKTISRFFTTATFAAFMATNQGKITCIRLKASKETSISIPLLLSNEEYKFAVWSSEFRFKKMNSYCTRNRYSFWYHTMKFTETCDSDGLFWCQVWFISKSDWTFWRVTI